MWYTKKTMHIDTLQGIFVAYGDFHIANIWLTVLTPILFMEALNKSTHIILKRFEINYYTYMYVYTFTYSCKLWHLKNVFAAQQLIVAGWLCIAMGFFMMSHMCSSVLAQISSPCKLKQMFYVHMSSNLMDRHMMTLFNAECRFMQTINNCIKQIKDNL